MQKKAAQLSRLDVWEYAMPVLEENMKYVLNHNARLEVLNTKYEEMIATKKNAPRERCADFGIADLQQMERQSSLVDSVRFERELP